MNITRESVIKAIEKIDLNPKLRVNRNSSTYDLVYNGNTYPPILVLSEANKLNGEKELFLSDFNNNVELPFKMLKNHGFEIKNKNMSYFEELIKFLQQAKTGNLKTSGYLKTFSNLKVKVSFGQGVSANIPWISFLREGMSTSTGIYPGYLFFKNENILILTYGISETNEVDYNWQLNSAQTITTYFFKNKFVKPLRYGKSLVCKVYDINQLPNREILDNDLLELIDYYKSLNFEIDSKKEIMPKSNFNHKSFRQKTQEAGLIFSEKMVTRFVASLCTKPFVICSGLSGSGKTKLAQAFVQWICESDQQYKIIPVGADWTNREPLLGYPNAIETDKYVIPENGALQLIIDATGNVNKPYFLILDEMNLSHVERYFADFLSAMESGEAIPLHTIENNKLLIPKEIKLPQNLFIIGTVNIDETTYMFSPKVLDRANTIEFRLSEEDLKKYFESTTPLNMKTLGKEGVSMAANFVEIATDDNVKDFEKLKIDLLKFFNELKKSGAEYGYRTASEIGRLIQKLESLGEGGDDLLDIAIMQKLLPKLHGSRSKLSKVLITLGGLCLKDSKDCESIYFKKIDEIDFKEDNIKYKLSFEKIIRMYKNALENGFASYAEA